MTHIPQYLALSLTNISQHFCFSALTMLQKRKFTVLFSTDLHMVFLLFLSLLCLEVPNATATTPTNETDRLALIKMKESIADDPYDIFSSWNDSIHFCNWQGVTCGRKHRRVTVLDLQGSALRGSISPYIGNLSFLRWIDLKDNLLHGEIPREITHLFRLEALILNNNSISGQIPSNLTSCPELKFIRLVRNNLTGNIPVELGSLRKLEFLAIASNNLAGGIPPSLGNLSSCRLFSLGANNFVGNIPDAIGQLQRLYFFGVMSANLSGMIPYTLYNISTMRFFLTGGNRLNGTLPANIDLTLPNLRTFSIASNRFFGPIPTSLSNVSGLEVLDLNMNNFVGQVPTNLGNLLNLTWLGIGANNLGTNPVEDFKFLTSMKNCTKLKYLDSAECNFGGSLPNSIGNLSIQLNELFLGGNLISGSIPTALENLINLNKLGMELNHFVGTIPAYFGKFQNLQGLRLDGNRLSGRIPSSIGNLTGVVLLYLSQNNLEGGIPSSFGNCKSLQVLYISENNLSGTISRNSFSSQLLELNLSRNSLSGTLPVEVGNLKNIYKLDVSENNLFGEIPRSIGDCMNLEYLYLQGNLFQGPLPPSLASLKGLQYLDLSRNNLSGPIPKDLQKLVFVLYLNISFNDLAGEVPTGGVFQNASKLSVTGNKNLCGGIRELRLQACNTEVQKGGMSNALKLAVIIVSGVLCFFLFSSILVLYWRRRSEKKRSFVLSTTDLLWKVSYRELYQATGGFSSGNLIGSGSFGSVYKGIMDQEERIVAVKVLNLQQKGASKSFAAECNVLSCIRHRNLVKILTCCSSVDYNGNEFKALVFEFMEDGSLEKWLHPDINNGNHSRNLNLLQRLNIAIDVASALHYLHEHSETPIIHCDLKPSNVLLDNDMTAHVSDFGLARLLHTNDVPQNQTSTVGVKGSIGYTAPEYGMGSKASKEGDVYGYGILLLEIFTGKTPTDKMFEGGLNLHNLVKMALPERLVEILEPNLLKRDENEAISGTEEDQNGIETEEERSNNENLSLMNSHVKKCLLSVLELGLACSLDSPKERMNTGDITEGLSKIRNAFL